MEPGALDLQGIEQRSELILDDLLGSVCAAIAITEQQAERSASTFLDTRGTNRPAGIGNMFSLAVFFTDESCHTQLTIGLYAIISEP